MKSPQDLHDFHVLSGDSAARNGSLPWRCTALDEGSQPAYSTSNDTVEALEAQRTIF